MKYTLAIAALVGLISESQVNAIEIAKAPVGVTMIAMDSESSDEENVQLAGDDSESDHSKEFYNAWNAVKDDEEGYHRVIPAYFSGDGDDIFMRSMVKTYALEGKNKDGSPNGNFMMDEAVTRAAASEVLETHKGLTGDAKKKYLDTYFPRTFAHFDVTKDGKIEVIKAPQFMRFLASDQYMSLLPWAVQKNASFFKNWKMIKNYSLAESGAFYVSPELIVNDLS